MGCLQSRPAHVSESSLKDVVIFFDCDDTLYQNNWHTAELLKHSIEKYTVSELGLDEDYAYQLYLEHGTALRGLLQKNHLGEELIEHFLQDVHDVSLDDLKPDPELRKVIEALGHKKRWVFTASIKEHAERCLERLGIADLFLGIIDCRSVGFVTKHDPYAFIVAMEMAGVTDPSTCLLLDDSIKNMTTAKNMGWKTCVVGKERGTGKDIVCADADFNVNSLLEVPWIMPSLFTEPSAKKRQSSVGGTMDEGASASRLLALANTAQVSPESDNANGEAEEEAEEDEEDEDEDEEEAEDEAEEEAEERAEDGATGAGAGADAAEPRKAVFVLGGPGCGKGTQCGKVVGEMGLDFVHLSVGDLLREEIKDKRSKHGTAIAQCIKEGSLVPTELTMKLLVQALERHDARYFLIDGCPRDLENYDGWLETVQEPGHATLAGVLFYDADEDEMLQRIMERARAAEEGDAGSARADDNAETARKRFATFRERTMPLVDKLRDKDGSLFISVDASKSIDDVFSDTQQAVHAIVDHANQMRS